jgi:hypothetical protein
MAALAVAFIMLLSATAFGAESYPYDAPDTSNFVWYHGNYDPDAYPQKDLDSEFTTEEVLVDGVKDDAYAASASSPIENRKLLIPDASTTSGGLLTSVWDGALLYLLVEVEDGSKYRDDTLVDGAKNPIIPASTDSVNIALDFYNDKTWYETDTAGVLNISASGAISYFENGGIPSLGSVFSPNHPEHLNRIASYAVAETDAGYNVEVAISLGDRAYEDSPVIGIDVQINDINYLLIPEVLAYDEYVWWSPTPIHHNAVPAHPAVTRGSSIFWSHDQDSAYAEFDNERPKSVDWGNVTLVGGSESLYKASAWQIEEIIRFTNSLSFPKDVYTPESQAAFDQALAEGTAALAAYNSALQAIRDDASIATSQALIVSGKLSASDASSIKEASDKLKAAFDGLRWGDTKYPDPAELPDLYTLPNPYQFFQSDRVVENAEDWEERKAEILDLAQFYEYGYKPGAPDGLEIVDIKHVSVGDMVDNIWLGPIPATVASDAVTVAITVGAKTENIEFTVYLPTDEEIEAAGHTKGSVPVILSYDGDNPTYRTNGYAVVVVPQATGGDGRSTLYAWGARTGAFYELYPYVRNGSEALNEVSSEMAAAWSASRVIDALELLKQDEDPHVEAIDPTQLAVTGFSINGKYAFVAGVFDDRIDVVMPGAAGATGPSPWRYVYLGHEYDWTGTDYVDADGANPLQVASGTEMIANSVRHNRVRETELFRHFMTPGHFYEHRDGAYGFASRLPFDQSDLVATLAGRAIVLINTVDDYNDGSEADSLGLEVAKAVYNTLGYDADELVKFNLRGIRGINGVDPHGSEDAQYVRVVEYLDHYFLGAELDEETDAYLNQNPFTLPISKGQSPFDYYYGGLNTITGGTGGVEGTDGWYYYELPIYAEEVSISGESSVLVGETIELEAEVLPADADDITVTWSSSDTEVASVDSDGIVTGKKAGTAIITATANGSKVAGEVKATLEITVSASVSVIYATDISIDGPTELKVGETAELTAEVLPEDATDLTVTWSSSDEEIATVDEDGVVTAKSAGTVTITATANGSEEAGSVVASIDIEIAAAPITDTPAVPPYAPYVPSVVSPAYESGSASLDVKAVTTAVEAGTPATISAGVAKVELSPSLLKELGPVSDSKVSVTFTRLSSSPVLNSTYQLTTTVAGRVVHESVEPVKLIIDVSKLPDSSKTNLTGVLYKDNSLKVSSRLGGILSADKKTFTFYAYDNTALYGLLQAPDLLALSLVIGSKDFSLNGATRSNDVAPYIDPVSNRTMVPLRLLSETLGADVSWEFVEGNAIKVTIKLEGKTLTLVTGQALPSGLGTPVINAASGRTMIPARWILVNLGANVVWDAQTTTVHVYK